MEFIRLNSDYTQGAHQSIIDLLVESNMVMTSGYGEDEYCEKAKELIKNACNAQNVAVHFLVGGTQTNLTVISSALRPHQGVISAESGHIEVHETGAVEACGHKVITIKSEDGKIYAKDIQTLCDIHRDDEAFEHTVQPKMVYISNSTEYGTIYNKAELYDLAEVCKKNNLYLFMDGARLGYALSAKNNDLTLEDVAKCCDVFYIGGTKCGSLFGEAVVITNDKLKEDFRYIIKQKGGMLAKGRLLGIQFIPLFTNNLYLEICQNAIICADIIVEALKQKNIRFEHEPVSNQLFLIIENDYLDKLKEKYVFSFLGKYDENYSKIRICTSWATQIDDVKALAEDIKSL